MNIFLQKVVLLGVKEFHGLHDYLKIISKKLTLGCHVQKICPPKNGVIGETKNFSEKGPQTRV